MGGPSPWVPPDTRVTRGGVTLSARMWAALEDAYTAAGLDPARFLAVSKGSWVKPDPTSGTTHAGGGAADLRVTVLPTWARANLCGRLVVELRTRLGLPVWYRDEAHGGFAPHIHAIMRDEPGLSSGARWQVGEATAGRDGLTRGGPDYHPRPTWVPYVYPPDPGGQLPSPIPPLPSTPIREESPMLVRALTGTWWLLTGGHLSSLDGQTASNARAAGVPAFEVATPEAWANLARTYPVVKG
jgi:hypothetical protein